MRSLAGRLVVLAIWPFALSLPLRLIVTALVTESVAPDRTVTLLKQYVLVASFTMPLLTVRFPLAYVKTPPLIPVFELSEEHAATVGSASVADGACCVTVPLTVPAFDTVVPAVTKP